MRDSLWRIARWIGFQRFSYESPSEALKRARIVAANNVVGVLFRWFDELSISGYNVAFEAVELIEEVAVTVEGGVVTPQTTYDAELRFKLDKDFQVEQVTNLFQMENEDSFKDDQRLRFDRLLRENTAAVKEIPLDFSDRASFLQLVDVVYKALDVERVRNVEVAG